MSTLPAPLRAIIAAFDSLSVLEQHGFAAEFAKRLAPAIFRDITRGRKQVTDALARLAEDSLDDAAIAELLGEADGEARGEKLVAQWRPDEERRLLVQAYLQGYAEAFCRARRVPAPTVTFGRPTVESMVVQMARLAAEGFVSYTSLREAAGMVRCTCGPNEKCSNCPPSREAGPEVNTVDPH